MPEIKMMRIPADALPDELVRELDALGPGEHPSPELMKKLTPYLRAAAEAAEEADDVVKQAEVLHDGTRAAIMMVRAGNENNAQAYAFATILAERNIATVFVLSGLIELPKDWPLPEKHKLIKIPLDYKGYYDGPVAMTADLTKQSMEWFVAEVGKELASPPFNRLVTNRSAWG